MIYNNLDVWFQRFSGVSVCSRHRRFLFLFTSSQYLSSSQDSKVDDVCILSENLHELIDDCRNKNDYRAIKHNDFISTSIALCERFTSYDWKWKRRTDIISSSTTISIATICWRDVHHILDISLFSLWRDAVARAAPNRLQKQWDLLLHGSKSHISSVSKNYRRLTCIFVKFLQFMFPRQLKKCPFVVSVFSKWLSFKSPCEKSAESRESHAVMIHMIYHWQTWNFLNINSRFNPTTSMTPSGIEFLKGNLIVEIYITFPFDSSWVWDKWIIK